MVYIIQVCWQLASGITSVLILFASRQQTCMTYHCVQWKTPDDGQRNCPKDVEFYSENKFEKLVYLVGFIIRIYHDARSAERQVCQGKLCNSRTWPLKIDIQVDCFHTKIFQRKKMKLTYCMVGWTETRNKEIRKWCFIVIRFHIPHMNLYNVYQEATKCT